jgi:hypothetical protein
MLSARQRGLSGHGKVGQSVAEFNTVSPKRFVELEKMLGKCKAGLVYVSAFPDLAEFKKHAKDIHGKLRFGLPRFLTT